MDLAEAIEQVKHSVMRDQAAGIHICITNLYAVECILASLAEQNAVCGAQRFSECQHRCPTCKHIQDNGGVCRTLGKDTQAMSDCRNSGPCAWVGDVAALHRDLTASYKHNTRLQSRLNNIHDITGDNNGST